MKDLIAKYKLCQCISNICFHKIPQAKPVGCIFVQRGHQCSL